MVAPPNLAAVVAAQVVVPGKVPQEAIRRCDEHVPEAHRLTRAARAHYSLEEKTKVGMQPGRWWRSKSEQLAEVRVGMVFVTKSPCGVVGDGP